MKNNEIVKIQEAHTNRLLISTGISFLILIGLLLVNKAQNSGYYVETRNATLAVAIIFAVAAVAVAVRFIIKKEKYLIEYLAFTAVMAFCFYCIHGVGFVNARMMKYVTGVLVALYFIGSYIYHTLAPKYLKK